MRTVVGVDLAFKRDSSAAVVIQADPSRRTIRVPYAEEWTPTRHRALVPSEVCSAVVGIARRWEASEVVADVHGREVLREHTSAAGLGLISFEWSSRDPAYTHARIVFLERRLSLVAHERLVAQLRDTLYEPRKGGKVEVIQARGRGHGDLVSALVAGMWALQGEVSGVRGSVMSEPSERWRRADPWEDDDDDDAPNGVWVARRMS